MGKIQEDTDEASLKVGDRVRINTRQSVFYNQIGVVVSAGNNIHKIEFQNFSQDHEYARGIWFGESELEKL